LLCIGQSQKDNNSDKEKLKIIFQKYLQADDYKYLDVMFEGFNQINKNLNGTIDKER
jgi:hypothetical protein